MAIQPFSVYSFYFPSKGYNKFYVAVSDSDDKFCFFINTMPYYNDIMLLQHLNLYLKHDSYLNCSKTIQFDIADRLSNKMPEDKGCVGKVNSAKIPEILEAIKTSRTLSKYQIKAILKFCDTY